MIKIYITTNNFPGLTGYYNVDLDIFNWLKLKTLTIALQF